MPTTFSALAFSAFLLAAILSAAVVYCIVKSGWQWAMDLPGARSLHSAPVPRTGGLALVAAVIATGALVQVNGGPWPWLETLLAAALCIVSLIDDKRGLPVTLRLATHGCAALLYVGILLVQGRGADASLPVWIWLPLALLTIVAMTNFYNFMDGSNGLAGGMALIGFGTFAIAAGAAQPSIALLSLALLSLALAGSALGFLLFNWRGRIFMGDGGSVPLGFLAAGIGLAGWLAGAWTLWFPALVFAPFIVDASVTLLQRWRRGERVSQAHRDHYYQRLVRMGMSHARVALGEYALMLACAAAALALPRFEVIGQALIFATIALPFLLLMLLIDARWHRHLAQAALIH